MIIFSLRFERRERFLLWIATRLRSFAPGGESDACCRQYCQTDPYGGSRYAYISDDQSCLRFLNGKTCSTRDRIMGFPALDLWICRGIGLRCGFFPMDLRDKAMLFHEVLIGF
jgi:hypothetical protein